MRLYSTEYKGLCCKKKADLGEERETSERGPLHEQPEPASLQVASLSIRHHSLMRQMVSGVCAQLSGPRRNDAGAGTPGRSYDDLSLGPELCSRTGKAMPSPFETHD